MTPAKSLEPGVVAQSVQIGKTQEEVRRVFGIPNFTEAGSNGKRLDVFIVQFPKIARVDRMSGLEVRSLFVRYGRDNRVDKFNHYAGEVKGLAVAQGEIWRAGRPFSDEKLRRIKQGETGKDELIEMFGRPSIVGFDVYGLTLMRWVYAEGRNSALLFGQELIARVDVEVVTGFAVRNLAK